MLRFASLITTVIRATPPLESDEQREAAIVSPCIAVVTATFFVSLVLEVSVVNSAHVFATTSNACFLAAALYVHLYGSFQTQTDKSADQKYEQESYYMTSNLETVASLSLAVLGAASFGFHAQSVLFQPLHSFDIFFSWNLALALFYVSSSACVFAILGSKSARKWQWVVYTCYLACVCVLIVWYDTFYQSQVWLMSILAGLSIIFGVSARLMLTEKPFRCGWPVALAIVEWVALIVVGIGTVFANCSLVGKTIGRDTDLASYDLYHGMWHVLLSYLVSIIFLRSLSVARMIERSVPVCVCSVPLLDLVGEGLVCVLSLLVLVCKEAGVDPTVSFWLVSVVALTLVVHGVVTTIESFSKR